MPQSIAPTVRALLKRVILWNSLRLDSFWAEVWQRDQFYRFQRVWEASLPLHQLTGLARVTHAVIINYSMGVSLIFFIQKCKFWSRVHMLPLSEKTKFKMLKLKKVQKIYLHVYLYIVCAHTKFHVKRIFFVTYTKKTKICCERAYFTTKFYHFYIGHIKVSLFLKRLRGHVWCGDLRITFFIWIFYIFI
jgi:hypothetical protein